MKKRLGILIFLLTLLSCADKKQESVKDKDIKTLTGIIKKEKFWGPPNFGDDTLHDKIEMVPILILNEPLKVLPDSDFNHLDTLVYKLQVLTNKNIDEYLYKKVIVKGTILSGQTGHHHTDRLLTLTEISASR